MYCSTTYHRLLFTTALSFFLVLLCIGCGNTSSKSHSNTIFHDDYGRDIAVPDQPQRVVSLSPAVTEIIFALGGDDLLVGRTDFCKYPDEAQQIESIGGISNINIEKILTLKPDLVISGSMVPKKSAEHLDAMGIPLACVIEKAQYDGLYENIQRIGNLINRRHEADSLVNLLKNGILDIKTDTLAKRPTLYYVVGFGAAGNFTAGGNTFINEIIQMAGAENIANDIKGWNYSLEALMQADPDYILIRQEDAETFVKTSPYTDLTAVKSGNVIPIESGLIDLQVPRNIEAIKLIHKWVNGK